MQVSSIIAALLFATRSTLAHFTFVHKPSQIACYWEDDWSSIDLVGGRINWLSHPLLEGDHFEDWWMHGQVQCQNKTEGIFELPSGGRTTMVMSSRVMYAPPPYGIGSFNPTDPDYVMTAQQWIEPSRSRRQVTEGNHLGGRHNIHSYTRDDTSGCALAIAYKSKAIDVKPKDFVIFSVVHDCPKRQREYIDVPNLPSCPDGNCICAWFWNPKNSGTKNFYMTPFVCNVTGADPFASPIDVEYAIPPRRCLDPENCNFGPRLPMYYLFEASEHINMAEPNYQSPHYSIMYGFREGAQHDIFENTNPRRHIKSSVAKEEPPRCDDITSSRLSDSDARKTSWVLKSSNCMCTAELDGGVLKISLSNNDTESSIPTLSPTLYPTMSSTELKSLDIVGNNGDPYEVFPLRECQGDCDSNDECRGNLVCLQRDAGDIVPGCLGSDDNSKTDYCIRPSVLNETIKTIRRDPNLLWQHNITTNTFGPMDVVENPIYKAGPYYFPMSTGAPYTMELNDLCYLFVTTSDGVVVWESPVDDYVADEYVIDTFHGYDPDPSIWPIVMKYTPDSTTSNSGKDLAPSITWISSQETRVMNHTTTSDSSQEQEEKKAMSNDVDLIGLRGRRH